MDRRTFLATLAAVVTRPGFSRAQSRRPWRIGWLSPASSSTDGYELEALRAGLSQLNYVEGRSIVIETRWVKETRNDFPSWRVPS